MQDDCDLEAQVRRALALASARAGRYRGAASQIRRLPAVGNRSAAIWLAATNPRRAAAAPGRALPDTVESQIALYLPLAAT